MPDVNIQHLDKIYDGGVQAVYDFNLDIADGEFIVLVGPSGCGKSTTLRMVAGLEDITNGNLIIDGKDCTRLPPKDRDIAMVFQNYALYGHMTIYENMAFSLTLRKEKKDIIHRKVMAAAEILDLKTQLNKKPRQLSGGQRQRVAMGRAIVRNPKVFLFDEPLSNLDAKLRGSMRRELMLLHKKLNATIMYVTHDQTEALTLADRIVCMSMGHVQQIGKPIELYEQPANTFVATFIGLPPMNMFEGKIEGGKFKSDFFEYPLNAKQVKVLAEHEGKEVILGVRPENIIRENAKVNLIVTNNENLGMNTLVHGKVEAKETISVTVAGENSVEIGKTVSLAVTPDPELVTKEPVAGCTSIKGKIEGEHFTSKVLSFALLAPIDKKKLKSKKSANDPEVIKHKELEKHNGEVVYYNIKPEAVQIIGEDYKVNGVDVTLKLKAASAEVKTVEVPATADKPAEVAKVTVIGGEFKFSKIVVCKFAEWCSYKDGETVKIAFDPEMMHFFEIPERDENGKELPGKAIR